MTIIGKKSFTLTLDDCLDAFSQKKISPERRIAPGLLILGGGLAMLLTLAHPIMEKSALVHAQVTIAYLGCGIACSFGLLLWHWEGKSSMRRKMRNFQRQYAAYLTPKEAFFDAEEWTVHHEDGSEDKRKFAHLKGCWEKERTIILDRDARHIFPKRVFSEDELAELRRLCRVEVHAAETVPRRRPESALSAFVGIMEYVLWRYRLLSALLVLVPLVIAPWAFMNAYENPRSGMTEYTFAWWKIIVATTIWYGAILIYKMAKAISFARKVRYGAMTDDGFTFTHQGKTIYAKWSLFSDAHEGRTCFLFEERIGSYQLFCKRVFSESEKQLMRSKVTSIKRGMASAESGNA